MDLYISVILILIGVSLFIWNIKSMITISKLSSWAISTGEIIKLDWVEIMKAPERESGEQRRGHRYHLDLLYRYKVNGKEFEGDRLRFGPIKNINSKSVCDEISSRFGVGSSVDVYYDRKNPKQSTLELSQVSDMWVGLLVSVVFITAGVFMWLR
ncbi:DUF3592 domain-containing protein [Bacteriovoracaceae bacterium]|nr:DUF3592 domain-containing protein [Bacteriovoracaceae bacterium]